MLADVEAPCATSRYLLVFLSFVALDALSMFTLLCFFQLLCHGSMGSTAVQLYVLHNCCLNVAQFADRRVGERSGRITEDSLFFIYARWYPTVPLV